MVDSDWLTFGARCGSGWGPSDGAGRALAIASARTDAREKAQGRLTSLYSTVACRNSKSDFESVWEIFSDRSRRFPINRGGKGGGGGVRNFFLWNFFFFAILGAGRGEGGEGDPKTRGTSCAIPSWNVPKLIFESRR